MHSRLPLATTLLYYTDGSVGERCAAGAAVIHGDVTISHRLPAHATSFQAELVAILLALRYAWDAAAAGAYTHVHIFTDSYLAPVPTYAFYQRQPPADLLCPSPITALVPLWHPHCLPLDAWPRRRLWQRTGGCSRTSCQHSTIRHLPYHPQYDFHRGCN